MRSAAGTRSRPVHNLLFFLLRSSAAPHLHPPPTSTPGCPRISSSLTQLSSFSSSPPPQTLESNSATTFESRGLQQTRPVDAADVFRRWGCSDDEVSDILRRQPSLRRMDLVSLQSKLEVLRDLGLLGPDLVRVVKCRPRFLAGHVGRDLNARLQFLRTTLFESDAGLLRAVTRNPSLLGYDVERTLRPCVDLYEGLGVGRYELGRLLVSRPTIIPRSTLDDEKLELIRRTGLPRAACMYKYVVSIIAISRLDTIRQKVANLEKFGFSLDEVLGLFARTPNILTLSVEKVQRNMTYIVGTMKLPASIVLRQPFLLYSNLEMVLKPRFLLGGKLREIGVAPQIGGESLIKALRMKETRFLKVFVNCHEGDVSGALMDFYAGVKGVRRLAEASRSNVHKGFPF